MSFEIARNISGNHTLSGGPAEDGIWFGSLPNEVALEVWISRIMVAGSFPRVLFRDANGTTILQDYTTEAAAAAGDIPWPNSTNSIADKLQVGVTAGHTLKGIMMRLARAANWTDSNLNWAVTHPGATALVSVPHSAVASDAATVLRTGSVGDLIYIEFATPLDTDDITPVPIGVGDNYWRRIDIGLTGTITGGTTFPLISRVWPVWDRPESQAYTDFTGIQQPMSGTPDYSAWPDQVVIRQGDQSLLGCREWPFAFRWLIDQSSGSSGATTDIYSSNTGIKEFPAGYANDPSNFGRAAPGTYQVRYARPTDAAKMWVLTYTEVRDGITETHTVFDTAEPTLPAGATQVRKVHAYLVGRRYNVSHPQMVAALNIRIACRTLDPATMTSTLNIAEGSPLTRVAVEAEYATDVAGESSWFVVNRRTGQGALIRDTLTQDDPSMSAEVNLSRQAGDGFLLCKVRDKTGAGAEAEGGELVISG